MLAALKVTADFTQRPFRTLNELREFRDTMAHGKPVVVREEKEVVVTAEQLDDMGFLQADWEHWVTLEYLQTASTDLDDIWKMLLTAAKLVIFDTLRRGSGGVIFIEHA